MKLQTSLFSMVTMLVLLYGSCYSQSITTPQESSPAAQAWQTIGISTMGVHYSRPAVKGRIIWGELVPYGWNVQSFGLGNPSPWRAGANENTTITLSHEARIEGHTVPAGTYGLFFVINPDNSGEVILSKRYKAWGSFFYDKADDQLRAAIKLRDNQFSERLTYDFINMTNNACDLVLNWEKKQFPVHIEFAVNETVMANAREELQGPIGFSADGFISAAFYSFKYNIDLEQGMKWIDQALAMEPTNFEAIRVKSRILVRNGHAAEADQLLDAGLQSAAENDINSYGYQLLQVLGLHDKAIKVFLVGTQRFPKSPNAWDSLGEAYAANGNNEQAKKCFRKALSLNPTNATRANSEKYLKQLETR